jgi:phage host-nuclease inhibitor protein Gam
MSETSGEATVKKDEQNQQDPVEATVKTDEQTLKEQVEPIVTTYVDLQRDLNTLRSASTPTSDADWTAFGAKVDTASSALKTVATAVAQYKSTAPIAEVTTTNDPKNKEDIARKLSELRQEVDRMMHAGENPPQELYQQISHLKALSEEIPNKELSEVQVGPEQEQRNRDELERNSKQREADAAAAAQQQAKALLKKNDGGGSSTSKKNRKSHKSYHPGIGKTRKHHSHSEPKRVSFVHQA